MTPAKRRSPRRSDALSRTRIVEAAIQILDSAGESGLTVRAVTAHLATGRGAIYHHVANKDELLAAAADGVIGQVIAAVAGDEDPRRAIRALALGIFEAIDAHPWVGAQLAREPLQPAVLQIWTSIGLRLHDLGVAGTDLPDAGSALVNYILGAAAQHAAGARRAPDDAARRDYLERLAAEWARLDAHPLVRESASLLREHDDREQFLAGVEIYLAGVAARPLAGDRASRRGRLHHLELWMDDATSDQGPWPWLLRRLGYTVDSIWETGRSWVNGDAYIVLESGEAHVRGRHDRLRSGLNHVALWGGRRDELDALVTDAAQQGWTLMFADRHPHAGGPATYAAYLEDASGFEVEIVAQDENPAT
ncbi:TetR family transcriptional regulator [Actinoplanes subtropicus]|uniref:TetR family transcriptional regulator n=1 Tax=Actinoplanes subtropicus TaxID=543632 RepID=UPI0007C496FE|nr:TetR family transcriptional regulator [Actinoplanes subtropicus]